MEITEVKIFPVKEEKLKAFVSIVLDDCFMVNDIKIIRGKDGYFISMPSRRKKNGKFKDVAHPLNNETRQRMEQKILSVYEEVAGGGERTVVRKRPETKVEETPAPAAPATDADADGKSLDEVAEAHLRDSFWGT